MVSSNILNKEYPDIVLETVVFVEFCSTEGEKKKKAPGKVSRKKSQASEDEAGEETDEGDMESREVDYMSDASSDSEQEFQVRCVRPTCPCDHVMHNCCLVSDENVTIT